MGNDPKAIAKQGGVHAGDWIVRPVPATGTDGHLDTPSSRERDLRAEQDARTAQHSDALPAHPLAPPSAKVIPVGEGGDVDASIEAARSAAMGDEPDDPPVPILLHDPITGKPIGRV